MTESRAVVEQYVREHPGSHFSAIVDALDQATGQVQHHVSRLVRDDRLERATVYGQTHYYPTGYDQWEKETLALLRRESARGIVGRLLDTDGQHPDALADDIGVSRSTVEYHLDRLIACGVVEKRRDETGRVSVHLERPHETALLLSEVAPTYADRFVDRFMQLVDGFLDDAA
ncbi:winged helix-turn-helix transcriptional regulator [Halorientalis litorea]|uniref:winged helix-turn-helix transcriptional regulator n=1 Tax=Halorientalis litorea TaxID=2931977 RepID=UPI001FF198E1|nr:winged helix-turn-helix transcriptional regulator [Halorientalis litorea]